MTRLATTLFRARCSADMGELSMGASHGHVAAEQRAQSSQCGCVHTGAGAVVGPRKPRHQGTVGEPNMARVAYTGSLLDTLGSVNA